MLATTSADHTVKLWDLKSRSLSKTLISHQRWVWDCTFSADSSYLVTCSSDHTARLWEIERGEVIRHYTGHHKAVICCALNDTSPPALASKYCGGDWLRAFSLGRILYVMRSILFQHSV